MGNLWLHVMLLCPLSTASVSMTVMEMHKGASASCQDEEAEVHCQLCRTSEADGKAQEIKATEGSIGHPKAMWSSESNVVF